MKFITKDMIKRGYNQGLIKLIASPNGDGIACQIGDYWFYFGGQTAEEFDDVEEYKSVMLTSDIIKDIYEVLKEFKTEFEDEYLYYYAYLKENLITSSKLLLKVEELNDNMLSIGGEIEDSDTILANIVEEVDFRFPGFSIDIFEIWKNSTDKKSIEQMFFAFTDIEFENFLERCIEEMSEKIEKYEEENRHENEIGERMDYLHEQEIERRMEDK